MGKINKKDMSREEWLRLRRTGIGSSDVGAILGLNQYRTPHAVYLEKTSEEPPEDFTNEAMEFGLKHEPVIAQTFQERTGLKVIADNTIRFRDDLPYMMANLDRVVLYGNGKGRGILELKTVDKDAYRSWTTEIPPSYYCQILHQMFVTGMESGDFALLIGGNSFKTIHIEYDPMFSQQQNERVIDFWENYVKKGIPPKMTGADAVMIKSQVGKVITASVEAVCAWEMLPGLKQSASNLKGQIEEQEGIIKGFMEDAEALVRKDGAIIATFKSSKDSEKIDLDRMKIEIPEIVEKYKITQPGSRRLLLKGTREVIE